LTGSSYDVPPSPAGTAYGDLTDDSEDDDDELDDEAIDEAVDEQGNRLRRGSTALPTSAPVSLVDHSRLKAGKSARTVYANAYRQRMAAGDDQVVTSISIEPRLPLQSDAQQQAVREAVQRVHQRTNYQSKAAVSEYGVSVDLIDDELFNGLFGREPRPDGRRVAELVAEQNACLVAIVASHRVHKAGLNVRHLGRVRAATTHPGLRALILSVCVARVMNQQLNGQMRELMRSISLPSDEPFKGTSVCVCSCLP
jgi:hypothetical protein